MSSPRAKAREEALFSEAEVAQLRERWASQLKDDLHGLSRRASLQLLAHRTLGAPAFLGRSGFRDRARELQALSETGNDAAIEAGWQEAQAWLTAKRREPLPGGLPPSKVPSHPAPAATPPISSVTSVPIPATPLQILIVDDDPVQRMVLERQVKKLGHRSTLANDGRAGLRAAIENAFDLILMDRLLPDIEGPRVLAMLRQRGLKTPAAILTANASDVEASTLKAAGVKHCVEKPLAGPALKTLIGELIAHAN